MLSHALRLGEAPCLAVVGTGGKSSFLFQLAREFPPPVLVTSTTHLHKNQINLVDSHRLVFSDDSVEYHDQQYRGVTLVTGPLDGNHTLGIGAIALEKLNEYSRKHKLPLIIDVDGLHQKSRKAPADYYPIISDLVDAVLVVAGLQACGKPLSEKFILHPKNFSQLTGLKMGREIKIESLSCYLNHPEGGLKGIPSGVKRLALLNQANSPDLIAKAHKIAKAILFNYQTVIITSFSPSSTLSSNKHVVHSVHERIAGIILAAGESKRYGSLKQLTTWAGKPLIRHIVETALRSSLSPLVLVTGAGAQEIEAAVVDLPIIIKHNPDWKDGQSSSLRVGLDALPPDIGAVVFILADQPYLTPSILQALTDRHSVDQSPIVIPRVKDRLSNPVLFDRVTFQDLRKVTGDLGGKVIFPKYPNTYLPWYDEKLPKDIDTVEDYAELSTQL